MAINFFNSLAVDTDVLYVDTINDKVGIGTSSPAEVLDVDGNIQLTQYGYIYFGSDTANQLVISNSLSGSLINQKGSGALELQSTSNGITFKASGSTAAVLTSSGDFGINETSPTARLHVDHSSQSTAALKVQGQGDSWFEITPNATTVFELGDIEQTGNGAKIKGTYDEILILDGNCGIGTSSPAEKLVVSGSDDVSVRINSTKNGTWTTDQILGAYEFYGNDASGAGAQIKAKIDCSSVSQYGAAFDMRFFTAGGGSGTSALERMRILYNGTILIGKTVKDSYNTAGIDFNPAGLGSFTRSGNVALLVNRSGSDGSVVSIRNDNTGVGSISVSGSTTAYNTTSDYRLKENVVDMTGSLDRIEQLQPKRFNFISEETTVDGFVAHEVQSIIPEAVLGEKDAVDEEGNPEYQGIDQAKIVPLLVGAIKELKAEIENLKLKINS